MKALCILAALALTASSMAQSDDAIDYAAAEKYIVECATDWAESVVTGDVSRRKVYFAEDFQGTGVGGERYEKAAVTRERGPSTDYVSNVIGAIDIHFFGSTAIAYGEETWTRVDGRSGRWVWTDIWMHRDGQWQVVAAQDNEIAAATAE
jgi:hypothetical protein